MQRLIIVLLCCASSLSGDSTYNISGGTQNFITNNYHNTKGVELENLYFRLGAASNTFEGKSFNTYPFTIQIFSESMRPLSLGLGMTISGGSSNYDERVYNTDGAPINLQSLYTSYELEGVTTLAGDNDGYSINVGVIWGLLLKDVHDEDNFLNYIEYIKNFYGFVTYLNTPHLLKWGGRFNGV